MGSKTVLTVAALAAAAALAAGAGAPAEPFTGKLRKEYVDYVRARVEGFIDYLKYKYPRDQRARWLIDNFKRVQWKEEGKEEDALLAYGRATGTVFVYDKGIKDPFNAAAKAVLNSQILHEMAHSTPANHDRNWRNTFLWFLQIATEELKWTVAIGGCSRCFNYGLCRRDMCPKCLWEYEPESCPRPDRAGTYAKMNCGTEGENCPRVKKVCPMELYNPKTKKCKPNGSLGDPLPTGRSLPDRPWREVLGLPKATTAPSDDDNDDGAE